jgi:hypothetical protein
MSSVRLLQHGVNLERMTLGWNVVGIVVLGVAAIAAGSVALAGSGWTAWSRSVRAQSCSGSCRAPARPVSAGRSASSAPRSSFSRSTSRCSSQLCSRPRTTLARAGSGSPGRQ